MKFFKYLLFAIIAFVSIRLLFLILALLLVYGAEFYYRFLLVVTEFNLSLSKLVGILAFIFYYIVFSFTTYNLTKFFTKIGQFSKKSFEKDNKINIVFATICIINFLTVQYTHFDFEVLYLSLNFFISQLIFCIFIILHFSSSASNQRNITNLE